MDRRIQLQSTEWKECRERIIEAAGGRCEHCGERDRLQVHHSYYEAGLLLWQYPDESLVCLCSPCHGELEDALQKLKMAMAGLRAAEIWQLCSAANDIRSRMVPYTGLDRTGGD
jgi:hypothetical protein